MKLENRNCPAFCERNYEIKKLWDYKIFSFSYFLFSIFYFLFSIFSFSQQLVPFNRDFSLYHSVDERVNEKSQNFHTSFKPYLETKENKIINSHPIAIKKQNKGSLLQRKIFYENLFIVDSGDFYFTIDPLFNFEFGKNTVNDTVNFYKNTRGIFVRGEIGKKLAFNTSFYEIQASFPDYIDEFIKKYRVIPGGCQVKEFKGSKSVYDYGVVFGVISYSPSQHFNFQFGHDKNFIGDGYRSLLLSDFAFQYPFLKITTNIGRFQYVNLLTSFQNIQAPKTWENGFQKKTGSFNYLSVNISKTLQLGLFEAIIWEVYDSSKVHFNWNYINPIIFLRPALYSLNSSDNCLVGLNLKYKLLNKTHFYGQFLVDDINLKNNGSLRNKFGYQIGFRSFDLFGIFNLAVQSELNHVQPYTYAQASPYQSYTHFNHPLAHPLGANFREFVSFINYRWKRLSFELKFNYATIGSDTINTHWGQNIFKSDYNAELGINSTENKFLQGIKASLIFKEARINYLLNPKTNLNIVLGISNRTFKQLNETNETNFIYIGIRTSLVNYYYDF